MRAELVMIGTELLLGETVDSNAAYLAQELANLGIDLYYKSTVGDNWLRMLEVLTQALGRSDLVITSGGLGPTMDDQTRSCLSALANRSLVLNPTAEAQIRAYFAKTNRPMSDNNLKQAFLPEGAQAIPNQWGTAPGILLELGNKILISLPGVPRELKNMFQASVVPYLINKTDGNRLYSRTLRFVGIGESTLEEMVKDIISNQTNPTIAPYASFGEVKLRITAKAKSSIEAEALIAPVEKQLRETLGQWLYGLEQDTLEAVVGQMLIERKETIATAESCTGGLIAHRLTNVPGSSNYFMQGAVTYSNDSKVKILSVPEELIINYGAVSEHVAKAMAEGVRNLANSTWGLAVTGIAGPSGGTGEKPVGLVYMAISHQDFTKAEVHRFTGNREEIKQRTAQAALNLVRVTIK